ncbi:hypothetical protein [Catellatospora tritici]|uniref:hypothetical protein n=1 Tax=Catellatospora tritici TaxID=2851566 RepID=UPI001C2D9650|nr:hypothetical protein [Catellatospora tritici]MBV1854305.1 hypothetical protein [Catellatospora tritici]
MTTPTAAAHTCRIAVCRGCCCGTDKHPGTDHRRQLDDLRQAPRATVTVTDCLGNCERSNTVVVVPSPAGRTAGGRVTWLAQVLDIETTHAVRDWVAAGGPGLAPLPQVLARHVQQAPQSRAAAG